MIIQQTGGYEHKKTDLSIISGSDLWLTKIGCFLHREPSFPRFTASFIYLRPNVAAAWNDFGAIIVLWIYDGRMMK